MINLKPARRYAFRAGAQVAELQKGGHDDAATKVVDAYSAFLAQFDDVEQEVVKRWLHNEYELGLDGALPLSGFVTNDRDGTITKTYSTK